MMTIKIKKKFACIRWILFAIISKNQENIERTYQAKTSSLKSKTAKNIYNYNEYIKHDHELYEEEIYYHITDDIKFSSVFENMK